MIVKENWYEIHCLIPESRVYNLEKSKAFYTVLGFKIEYESLFKLMCLRITKLQKVLLKNGYKNRMVTFKKYRRNLC